MSSASASSAPGTVLVYCHSWLPAQVDGVAVRIMAHVESLRDRGSKVVVATPDFVYPAGSKEAPSLNKIPGVEIVTLRTQLTPVYRKNMCLEMSFRNLMALIALIQRVRPDVVHATQEASIQVVATACLWCDVPLVISIHTDVGQIVAQDSHFSYFGRWHANVAYWFTKLGYRNWSRSGATFFPVSHQSIKILREAGVQDNLVHPTIWGPMVDRKLFCIDKPEEQLKATRARLTFGLPNAYLMVYVGRVTMEKDVQFLVDALERLPKNVVLALIGPGSAAAELSKLHGPEKRLHCTGELVGRPEVALAMRAADLCVSASVMETIGFTAMEALSCGTPMLAARAQGFALHLSHGKNARLWTPGDTASFDREFLELMNTKRSGAWSREALRESMAHSSVEHCTDRCVSVYESMRPVDKRWLRFFVTFCWFVTNWLCGFFMQ